MKNKYFNKISIILNHAFEPKVRNITNNYLIKEVV